MTKQQLKSITTDRLTIIEDKEQEEVVKTAVRIQTESEFLGYHKRSVDLFYPYNMGNYTGD